MVCQKGKKDGMEGEKKEKNNFKRCYSKDRSPSVWMFKMLYQHDMWELWKEYKKSEDKRWRIQRQKGEELKKALVSV